MGDCLSIVEPDVAFSADVRRKSADDRSVDAGDSAILSHQPRAYRGSMAASASACAARQRSLLADLIGPIADGDSLMAADALLTAFGSLSGVMEANVEEIDAVLPGFGLVAVAAREVGVELTREQVRGLPVEIEDHRLHDHLKRSIGVRLNETMVVIFVDRDGGYITDEEIGSGGGDSVQFRFRTIFRRALALTAPAVLIAHNHPSGRAAPSAADVEMAHAIRGVGAMLGVALIDLLIVTNRAIYSVAKGAVL